MNIIARIKNELFSIGKKNITEAEIEHDDIESLESELIESHEKEIYTSKEKCEMYIQKIESIILSLRIVDENELAEEIGRKLYNII